MKPDPLLTAEKLNELKNKLERLKLARPNAAAEVSRLAELGDFSENVEYQMAKGKLRGINSGILNLQIQIDNAVIIEKNKLTDKVRIGNTVTVEWGGKTKKYQILGAAETDPANGIISHLSPLGRGLMDKKIGEKFTTNIAGKYIEYKIIEIK